MDEIANKSKTIDQSKGEPKVSKNKRTSALTEFVGTAEGDTIGLVIANVDSTLHERLGLDKKYHSLGIVEIGRAHV